MMNFLKHYPLSLFTFLAVCILSLMPFPEMEIVEDVPFADKWTHMVMYGGLVMVVWFEDARYHRLVHFPISFCGLLVVAATCLGGFLELLQEYVTATRSGEWLDFMADFTGVLLGTLVGVVFWRCFRTKK